MPVPDLSIAGSMARAAETYGRVGPDFFLHAADGLVREIDPRPGTRVLDVGCGPGIVASALWRSGWTGELVGVDLVREMVHQARQRLGLDSASWAIMDGCELAFADETFDTVFCAGAIYQMPDGSRAATDMLRVLRSTGVLAFSIFDGRDPAWANLTELYRRFVPPLPDGHRYDGAALVSLLERTGAVDVRVAKRNLDVAFTGPEEWLESSWSHGERRAFEAMTASDYQTFLENLPTALEPARGRDGRLHWKPTAIYAWGTRAADPGRDSHRN